MNLDDGKSSDRYSWPRIGMLLCFGLAAAVLFISLQSAPPARAGTTSSLQHNRH